MKKHQLYLQIIKISNYKNRVIKIKINYQPLNNKKIKNIYKDKILILLTIR